MEVKFFYISWEQVDNMVTRLAARIEGKTVWGVPRGGSIVAAMMAYQNCPFVTIPQRAHVIVDDITDRGNRLRTYTQKTAALVVRYGCNFLPDYWVTMIDTQDYILFPWEYVKDVKEQKGYRTREG